MLQKNLESILQHTWFPSGKSGGYCYRAGDGINTNMFVEAFHRNPKYNYLHGKHSKHVDNLLMNLLKFSRDQVFERLIRLTKGKQTMRQKNMHESHLASK